MACAKAGAEVVQVDASKGTGFANISENDKWLESQSETRTTCSDEDLFNLLGNN